MKKENNRSGRGKRMKDPDKLVILLLAMVIILVSISLANAITTMLSEAVSTGSALGSRSPAESIGPNDKNTIHVVWEDDTELNESGYGNPIQNGPDKDIFYLYKDTAGWSSKHLQGSALIGGLEVVSDESVTSSENPDIVTDYNNITHVVWQGITKPDELSADPNTMFLAHFDNASSFDADYAVGQLSPLDSTGAVSSANSMFNRSAYMGGAGRLSYDAASHIDMSQGTIEFWYNPQHWPRSGSLYNLFEAWNSSYTRLGISWTDTYISYFSVSLSYNSSYEFVMAYYPPYEIKKNTWHHIAFAYDFGAGDCRFYFDGNLEGVNTSCGGTSFTPANFSIGASQEDYDNNYWRAEGMIDELRLSNVMRSADEIRGDAGQRDIFHRSLSGTTWSDTDVVTSDDHNNSYFPKIDVDRSNTLKMVWSSFHNSSFITVDYKQKSSGGSWSSAEVVSSGPKNHYPDIAVDQNNNSQVVWQNIDASSGDFSYFSVIEYRKRGMTSWAAIENVSNRTLDVGGVYPSEPGTAYLFSMPRIAIGGSNMTHVVWSTQSGFPDDDLLFYLSFDDMSPNITFANGSVASHADGTYLPELGENDNPIYTGYAAYVNESDSYLNYSASGNLNQEYGTIMAWVNPDWQPGSRQPSDTNVIFMYYSSNVSQSSIGNFISMYIKQCDGTAYSCADTNSALLYFHIYNSTFNFIATYNVTDWGSDEWRHVAATWNASGGSRTMNMYIDGSAIQNSIWPNTTDPMAFNSTPTEISIGNSFNQSTADYPFTFNGTIDEVMVFGRILGEDEIAAAMQRDFDIAYRQRNDSGWKGYELVSKGSNYQSIMPSIAAKDNNTYVAWPFSVGPYEYLAQKYRYGSFYKILMNTRNSTSWKNKEGVNDESSKEAYAPDIKAVRPGKIDVVWEDAIGINQNDVNIFYREFMNSTSPTVDIDYPTGGEIISEDFNVNATPGDVDSGISSVSFYYTSDDGISGNLICTAYYDPYSCVWNIGSTSEDIYKVKAIATSSEGGRNWSLSNDIYIDSSASVQLYTFNETGNSIGSNTIYKKAWRGETGRPNVTDPDSLGTDVTSDARINVSSPDGLRYMVSEDLGCGYYDFTNAIIFKLYINESVADIMNLKMQWRGHGYEESGYLTNMSLWNFNAGSWDSMAYKDFLEPVDSNLKYSLTSGVSDYLDPVNNTMYVMVETLDNHASGCGGGVFICPLYLSWNGTAYKFETEGILGMFNKYMEAPTFDRLNHAVPEDGRIKVAIAEVVDETTYMDQVSVIKASYPEGTQAMFDVAGNLRLIKETEGIYKVICEDRHGDDCSALVREEDERPVNAVSSLKSGLVASRSLSDPLLTDGPEGRYWVTNLSSLNSALNSDADEDNTRDYITLTLPEPEGEENDSKAAKLVISGSDTGMLGTSEKNLIGVTDKDSISSFYNLLDNSYFGKIVGDRIFSVVPIHVKVLDKDNNWVDYPGLFRNAILGSYRTIIIPLNRSLIRDNKVRLDMLAYSYMIDSIGVDYSSDEGAAATEMRSGIPELDAADNISYMMQYGENVLLEFHDPVYNPENASGKNDSSSTKTSYFLKTIGHYHPGEGNDTRYKEKISGVVDILSEIGRIKNGAEYLRMIYDQKYAERYFLDEFLVLGKRPTNDAEDVEDAAGSGLKNQPDGAPPTSTPGIPGNASLNNTAHHSLYTDFMWVTVSGCVIPVDNLEIWSNATFCPNGLFTVPDQDGNGRVVLVRGDNTTLDCGGSVLDSGGSDNPYQNNGRGTGIGVDQANDVIVKNCNVSRYGVGIGANLSSNVLLYNNTLNLNYIGVGGDHINNSVFRDNVVIGSYYVGIGLTEDSTNNTISNNSAINTSLLSYALEGADNTTLEFNIANGSADQGFLHLAGIGLTKGASYNTIRNNTITNLDLGIGMVDVGTFLGEGSYGLAGEFNNFSSNIISNMAINGIGLLYPYYYSNNYYYAGNYYYNTFSDYFNYFDQNNMVDGERVYYYFNVNGSPGNYVQINSLDLSVGNTSMFIGKITLVNCSYINITDNDVSGNFYGILVFESHDIIISNNRAYNNGDVPALNFASSGTVVGAGYVIMNSENISITGNNATDNFFGYYSKNSRNLTFLDNIAVHNSWAGFFLNTTNASRLINNSASLNDVAAYAVIYSQRNIITNNTAEDALESGESEGKGDRRKGFYFIGTTNNTITNNVASNCSYGFDMDTINDTFGNNTAMNNSAAGISFRNCAGGSAISETGNIVENNTGAGYLFDTCSNASISGLNTTGNNGAGFEIYSSHYLTMSGLWSKNNGMGFLFNESYNNTLVDSRSINSTSNEIYFYSSRDNNIVDSVMMNDVSANDVYSSANSWNYLLNTSVNESNFGDDTNSNVSLQWYLKLYIQNNEPMPLPAASIWLNDSLGNIHTGLSDADGNADFNLTSYVAAGGTKTYHSNYTWNITKSVYVPDIAMVNMSQNRNLTVTLDTILNALYWDYGDLSANGRISADFTPYLDGWAHVVLVSGGSDNSYKAIYINGNLVANETTSSAPTSDMAGLTLGGAVISAALNYFNGMIDDVSIWNRTLSDNEIKLLYENKTNVTHSDALKAGDNWTAKVTPVDSYGLNGSPVLSNGVFMVPRVFMNVVNQTPANIPTQIVNDTARINPYQNLTIRVNVTGIGGGLQNVWIIIWQTVKSAGDILWQGFMSLIGGSIWKVEVPVNWSYDLSLYNYTVYANFTGGNMTQIEGNFSVNRPPAISSVILNASSASNTSDDNLTAAAVATDPDGDAIELNYNWYRNGTSDAALNMPMTAMDKNNMTYDLSGNSNHGTVHGAAWNSTAGHGQTGTYGFDGINDFINISDSPSLNITGDQITMSAWIKLNNLPTGVSAVLSKGNSYMMHLITGYDPYYNIQILVWIGGNTRWPVSAQANIEYGKTYYVAGVYNGSNILMYVDGELVSQTSGTVNGSIDSVSSPLHIGHDSRYGDGTRFFNGTIDDARIYSRALSGNEIRLMYENKTNVTHADATTRLDNWTVKVTPIDSYGLNGSFVISNGIIINNSAPNIASIMLNATSPDNLTSDNLTATAVATDSDNDSIELNYNWYRNGISDTVLNMPMTAPDSLNMTYDFSGYGNHGNVSNVSTWNSTAGYNGFGAYQFDGINNRIKIGNNSNLAMNTSLTISVWVKPLSSTMNGMAIQQQARGWNLYFSGGNIYVLDRGGSAVSSGFSYDVNNWQFVALVLNASGTGFKVYKNGIAGNWVVLATGWNLTNTEVYIGGRATDLPFNGTIDDVRIYNRSLSANEISLLYANTTNVTHSDTLTAGDNWTTKVTPIDSYGINGSSALSNGVVMIPKVFMNVVNQTVSNIPTQLVNETNPINPNQNLTIRVNVTGIGGGLQNVWIIIWQTVKSAGDILWQGFMSLIGGSIWKVEVPVNWSYNLSLYNYTVYANFTGGNVTELEGNFSVNGPPAISSVLLNATSLYNVTNDNLTATAVATDPDGDAIELNYNWYRDGVSDTLLNLPMTAPDWKNKTYSSSEFNNASTIINATWNATGGYNGFGDYMFDGLGGYLLPQDALDIMKGTASENNGFTLSAWVKPAMTGADADYAIITRNQYRHGLHMLNGDAGCGFYNSSIKLAIVNGGQLTANKWSHIACEYNGTSHNFTFYLNGRANGSMNLPGGFYNYASLRIGTSLSGGFNFNGSMDEVRIYNRSLSAKEMALLYANQTNVTHSDALTAGDNWTVKVTPIDSYGLNGTGVLSNGVNISSDNPPSNVTLIEPSNNNLTLFNRTPIFIWQPATDPENEPITYTINITQSVCPDIIVGNITAANYTPSTNLCLDSVINWTVYASDGYANSTGQDIWGFKVASSLILTLTTPNVDFGSLNLGDEKNTSYAGAPDPIVVQNDGNIEADLVTVAANNSLWRSVGLGTAYFQFKANNRTTEIDAFNWSNSTTSWTNMQSSDVENSTVIGWLNWTDAKDNAEIDIRVQVPLDEPAGPKNSTLIITGAMSG